MFMTFRTKFTNTILFFVLLVATELVRSSRTLRLPRSKLGPCGVVAAMYGDNYIQEALPGAITLGQSIHRFGHPGVLLLSHTDLTEVVDQLEVEGHRTIRFVEPIANPLTPEQQKANSRPELLATYSKLHVFNTQDFFDRAVYMDVDMALLRPLDEICNLDLGENKLAAAPYAPCENGPASFGWFNAGFMTFDPSPELFAELMEFIKKPVDHDYLVNEMKLERWRLGGDQDVLNLFFRNQWGLLSSAYNFRGERNLCKASWVGDGAGFGAPPLDWSLRRFEDHLEDNPAMAKKLFAALGPRTSVMHFKGHHKQWMGPPPVDEADTIASVLVMMYDLHIRSASAKD